MPHIVLEYSPGIASQIPKLLQKSYDAVVSSGLFDPSAIKGRSTPYDHVILPDGASDFCHITVSILSGRTVEQRQSLGQSIFDLLPKGPCKSSVDIHEMDADTYKK